MCHEQRAAALLPWPPQCSHCMSTCPISLGFSTRCHDAQEWHGMGPTLLRMWLVE